MKYPAASLFLVLVIALTAPGFAAPPQNAEKAPAESPPVPGVHHLDAPKAAALAKKHPKTLVVLDVRTPGEFEGGHLKGAVNLDFYGEKFGEQLGRLDRSKSYLLHCRSGGRSGKALERMKALGFKSVYHLDGGMLAWEKAKLPVVKRESEGESESEGEGESGGGEGK